MCLFIDWGPPKTTTNLLFFFFPLNSTVETMRQRPPPSSSSFEPFYQTIFRRFCRLSVGCCVPPSTGSHRKSRPRRSLFFIFTSLYSTSPNDGQTSSPTCSALSHRLSNVPPSTEIIIHVGCCVPSSNGSHPRPALLPSLNFLLGAIGAPQSSYSATASPSPCTGCLLWA